MSQQEVHKLQEEVNEIKARNRRVELDKKRETSRMRKGTIALLTYIVVVLFFWAMGVNKPLLNALVPTMGFLLSTLSLGIIKMWWINKKN